jgi:hypothetical protein
MGYKSIHLVTKDAVVIARREHSVSSTQFSTLFFCPFIAGSGTPIIAMYGTFGHLAAQTKFGPQLLEEDFRPARPEIQSFFLCSYPGINFLWNLNRLIITI